MSSRRLDHPPLQQKTMERKHLLEDKGTGKEDKRLDVPFGNVDDEPTEGTKGLDIGKGGREPSEVSEVGARGNSGGIDGGMDKFGILPIPKQKTQNNGLYSFPRIITWYCRCYIHFCCLVTNVCIA